MISDRPWICFHCGFETLDSAEAEAHFGDRDDAEEFTPLCKWWSKLSETERANEIQDYLQQLNAERDESGKLQARIDGLEYQVASQATDIGQYFKGCTTPYQAFCLYDSMEGRALAAEEKLATLEAKA